MCHLVILIFQSMLGYDCLTFYPGSFRQEGLNSDSLLSDCMKYRLLKDFTTLFLYLPLSHFRVMINYQKC